MYIHIIVRIRILNLHASSHILSYIFVFIFYHFSSTDSRGMKRGNLTPVIRARWCTTKGLKLGLLARHLHMVKHERDRDDETNPWWHGLMYVVSLYHNAVTSVINMLPYHALSIYGTIRAYSRSTSESNPIIRSTKSAVSFLKCRSLCPSIWEHNFCGKGFTNI